MPPLAFAPANRSIKEYDETLLRLLTQVDAVDSNGSDNVKRNRKEIAVAIQVELDRIDSIKNKIWEKMVKDTKAAEEVKTGEKEEHDSTVVAEQNEHKAPAEECQDDTTKATDDAPAESTTASTETTTVKEETSDVSVDSTDSSADKDSPLTTITESTTNAAEKVTTKEDTPASAQAESESPSEETQVDTLLQAETSPVEESEEKPSSPVSIEITSESDTTSDEQVPTTGETEKSLEARSQEEESQILQDDGQIPLLAKVEERDNSTAEEDKESRSSSEAGDVEFAQSTTLPKAEEDNHAIFEVQSVSSQTSVNAENKELVQDSTAKNVPSEEKVETSSKATTVSDEEDDEDSDVASESSFEVL